MYHSYSHTNGILTTLYNFTLQRWRQRKEGIFYKRDDSPKICFFERKYQNGQIETINREYGKINYV